MYSQCETSLNSCREQINPQHVWVHKCPLIDVILCMSAPQKVKPDPVVQHCLSSYALPHINSHLQLSSHVIKEGTSVAGAFSRGSTKGQCRKRAEAQTPRERHTPSICFSGMEKHWQQKTFQMAFRCFCLHASPTKPCSPVKPFHTNCLPARLGKQIHACRPCLKSRH